MTIVDYAVCNNLKMLMSCVKPNDANKKDYYHFRGVLHWAVINGNEEMLRFWLGRSEEGEEVNINLQSLNGNTPLHEAVLTRENVSEATRLQIINILLDSGADCKIKNKEGQTPLSINSEITNMMTRARQNKYDFLQTVEYCVQQVQSEMEIDEEMDAYGYQYEKDYQPLADFIKNVRGSDDIWPCIFEFL